jgi:hypothetical protein
VAVLLTNTTLGLRRRADGPYDAHGERQNGALGATLGPWPGRTQEQGDGTWSLALDPAAWPVRENDLVVESAPGSRVWVVQSAQLLRNNADPVVDYIRVTGAQQTVAGTEPGGVEFVGRE